MFEFEAKLVIVLSKGYESPFNSNNSATGDWGFCFPFMSGPVFTKRTGMAYKGSLTGGNSSPCNGKYKNNTFSWYVDSWSSTSPADASAI